MTDFLDKVRERPDASRWLPLFRLMNMDRQAGKTTFIRTDMMMNLPRASISEYRIYVPNSQHVSAMSYILREMERSYKFKIINAGAVSEPMRFASDAQDMHVYFDEVNDIPTKQFDMIMRDIMTLPPGVLKTITALTTQTLTLTNLDKLQIQMTEKMKRVHQP